MKKIIGFLILLTLTSCVNIKVSISVTITGEYEDRVEYYQENQEFHKKYGLNYYPLDKKINISENKTIYLK